jgi:endonuclease III
MSTRRARASPARVPSPDLLARSRAIGSRLREAYPDASCALVHRNPFELLVATILSAQCTDTRVNVVTKDLFSRCRSPEDFLRLRKGALEAAIRSTGFYNAKSRSIAGTCRALVDRFGSRVPRTMEEMLELPGVARKTANVVLGTGYGIPSGFVVDTHIHRIARRLRLTRHDDPVRIEHDLRRLLPAEDWIFLGHALVAHGRKVCTARAPACERCPIADLCPSRGLPADAWKVRPKASRPSRAGSGRPSRGRRARSLVRADIRGARTGSDSRRSRRA